MVARQADGQSSLGNGSAFGLYLGVSSAGIGHALRLGISTVDSLAKCDAEPSGRMALVSLRAVSAIRGLTVQVISVHATGASGAGSWSSLKGSLIIEGIVIAFHLTRM
jgi:hypothetical protein